MSNKKRKNKKAAHRASFKNKLASWWNDRSVALRFLALFAMLMGVFYAFYFSELNIKYIHPHITAAQAKMGSWLLNLMGQGTSSTGENISGNGFSMSVSGSCDGLEVTALLVAGVLAFPSTWKEKWKGLLYGVGVLTLLNLVRLPVLYFAGAKGSMALFDFLHIQGGFIIFISITMLLWGYWVIQVLNRQRTAMPSDPSQPTA